MSVLKAYQKESKFEPIVYSLTIHDMLLDLMQRNFGVKDVDQFVRVRYARGKEPREDFEKYRLDMYNFKKNIRFHSLSLTNNLRAANTINPVNLREYENRRDYQTAAIVNCEQIINELQRVVDIFNVDVNVFKEHSKAINREIDLIKRWRQRDNKIKSRLQG